MMLKTILSHPDWDWKARRDLPKVIELFSNIVEKVTGMRPVTKGNSPLKKVAKQLVSKARAKSSKSGNFLNEEELKDKEHSWLSVREISISFGTWERAKKRVRRSSRQPGGRMSH